MKKYYDMPNSRIVAMLDWNDGYGTIDEAKKHLSETGEEVMKWWIGETIKQKNIDGQCSFFE